MSAPAPAAPPLVGRSAQLDALVGHLDRAASGRGRVVFLSGEAGIGKSRLAHELAAVAAERGFRVLTGRCFAESQTPYLVFLDALRSGGLEAMLADEPARVESLYVTESSGLVLAKTERKEAPVDPDIFASMLRVVEDFVRDSMAQSRGGAAPRSRLDVLGMEDYRIVIEQGPHFSIVAVVTGRENEFLLEDLRDAVQRIEARYGRWMADWDHTLDRFAGMDEPLRAILEGGKYDGTDYLHGDPQAKRDRFFSGMALGLERESRNRPILLALDDMHWAEPSTVALLHYLGRQFVDAAVLVTATYRPEDLVLPHGGVHPFLDAVRTMAREGLVDEIALDRLPEPEAVHLLASLLGVGSPPPDLAKRLAEESGGNPLFLIELTQLLVEERKLVREDGGAWRHTKEALEPAIPRRIAHVIAQRLERLPRETRDLLDLAAVLGDEFDVDLLSRSSGVARLGLLRTLRDLEASHRLVRPAGDRYRFDHPQVKEAIYGNLPDPLRREYHRLVAETIEAANAETKERDYRVMSDIAYHYYRARQPKGGVQYGLKAGLAARNLFANDQAVQFLTWTLELIGEAPGWDELLPALETRGDLHELLGRYDAAHADYARALGVTEDAETVARLHRKLGALHHRRGQYGEALDELGKARASLGDLPTPEAGRIELWRGRAYFGMGDYDRAVERYTAAREILEAVPGRDELDVAEALFSQGSALWTRGEVPEAREFFLRSMEVRKRLGDLRGLRSVCNNIASTYAAEESFDDALRFYRLSIEIADKIGEMSGAVKPLINMGRIRRMRGEFDDAREALARAKRLLLRLRDLHGLASVTRELAVLLLEMGQLDDAESEARLAIEFAEQIGDRLQLSGALRGLGDIQRERGSYGESVETLRQALRICEELEDPEEQLITEIALAGAYRAGGEREKAVDAARRAVGLARDERLERWVSEAVVALSEALRGAGRVAAAETALEEARDAIEGLGPCSDLVRFLLEMAQVKKAKGEEGAARLLLERAGEALQRAPDGHLSQHLEELKTAWRS